MSWASAAPVPVWLDHARELSEKWIHRQQILEAIGRPSDLRSDLARPVLDALCWAYPYRLDAHPRERGAFVEITIVDDQFTIDKQLVFTDEGWEFDGPNPTVRVASMSLSAEQAWRLLSNNYEASAHGEIATSGDDELISTFARTRAIIGFPK